MARKRKITKPDTAKTKRGFAALWRLSNPILVKYMNQEQIGSNVAAALKFVPPGKARERIEKLLSIPKVQSLVCPLRPTLSDLPSAPYFHIPAETATQLMIGVLQRNREALIDFQVRRRQVESDYLFSRSDRALERLAEIEAEHGQSHWLIRTKILLLSQDSDVSTAQEYCDQCKNGMGTPFSNTQINWYLILSNNPLLHAKGVIAASCRELRKAELPRWADAIELAYLPSPMFAGPKHFECIEELQAYHLCDKFVLATKLAESSPDLKETGELQKLVSDIHAAAAKRSNELADNAKVVEIINAYESGRYEWCQETCISLAPRILNPLALVNIMAKCTAALPHKPRQAASCPFEEIVQALLDTYESRTSFSVARASLLAKAISLNHFTDCAHIQLAALRAASFQFTSETRSAIVRGTSVAGLATTPLDAYLGSEPIELIGLRRITTPAQASADRILRHKIRDLVVSYLAEPNPQSRSALKLEALSALAEYQAMAPTSRDYLEAASSTLVAIGETAALIAECASQFSQNPASLSAFPTEILLEEILRTNAHDLDAVIVVFAIVREHAQDKRHILNEVFESHLSSEGVERPSELITLESDSKQRVLLRDISTLETLDFLPTFSSTADLLHERIRILDHLRERHNLSPDEHRREVDEIISRLVADTGFAEFNSAKICLDYGAIQKAALEDVTPLFTLYRSMTASPEDRFLRVAESPENERQLTIVTGNSQNVLLRIYSIMQSHFLFGETHGLDKVLSTEIRHGFFSNLIRAPLETFHLVTEIASDGEYESNRYWIDNLTLLADQPKERIDQVLRSFSRRIDELVTEAEEWMKVSTDIGQTDRCFRFELLAEEFVQLKAAADVAPNAEALAKTIATMLWEKTDKGLESVRLRLREDFARRALNEFSALSTALEEATPAALVDLFDAVRAARGAMLDAIEIAVGWFYRGDSFENQTRSIDDLIDVGTTCFKLLRPTVEVPTRCNPWAINNQTVSGPAIKWFLVALINIFENSVRHSGLGPATKIALHSTFQGSTWTMRIRNEISPTQLNEHKVRRIESAAASFSDPDNYALIRTEGGTGLTKIFRLLKEIDDESQFSFRLDGETFEAEISL